MIYNADRELESLPCQSLIQATNVHYGVRPDLRRLLFEIKGSSVKVLASGPKKMRQEDKARWGLIVYEARDKQLAFFMRNCYTLHAHYLGEVYGPSGAGHHRPEVEQMLNLSRTMLSYSEATSMVSVVYRNHSRQRTSL
ncbi:unnamed protein product [Lupinus luteus]|uniref:Uncharacterized protein n=1 Tax=Lupinus luteus TaxID=3873 RepID=A0AAV1X0B9_LUPLU